MLCASACSALGQDSGPIWLSCCTFLEETSSLLALPGYAEQTQKWHAVEQESTLQSDVAC